MTITDRDGIEGPGVVEYDPGSRLALDTVARCLEGTILPSDSAHIYDFPSLTLVLVFCEIVDGRPDVQRLTNPLLLGSMWRVRVSK